ncbi:extracellular solute-binding protein [Pseudomonadota bacterium]
MNQNKTKIVVTIIAITAILATSLTGCFRKEQEVTTATLEPATLVYYKMFDGEDTMKPLIQQYQAENPMVQIIYRKFDNLKEYEDLIINELAEGEGPDIFSVPNYWFLRHKKKISPLPYEMMTPEIFDQTFVSVATNDLVLRDPADGYSKIYGLPLTVDTLAVYYNKSTFEDKVPSRGRPAETWEELKEDVFKLTKTDNSFERFEVAGISMGRADNISRAVDILYLLMIQHGAQFYNENISSATFDKEKSITATGQSINPATEALDLYTSFALPANKNYSWNQYLADSRQHEKEMETFARGKVAMIFGYSYLYEDLKNKIEDLSKKGVNTMDPADIKIAPVPQVNDPNTSTEKRDAYANYFAETVSRTSENQRAAWDFLMFITTKENVAFYSDKTKKPTSRRDMIEDQTLDPIYGVFASQIGYAESLPIYDADRYEEIFSAAINSVLATVSPADAIKIAAEDVNSLLPSEGLIPPAPIITDEANASGS